MGLAENRAKEEYKKRIPETLKDYGGRTDGALSSVSVDIDWASFGGSAAALDGLWSVWEQPLQGAEAVCTDKAGKEAVKKALKKIVIKNVTKNEQVKAEFKSGVLTAYLNAAEGASGTPGYPAFQTELEKAL